MDKISKESDSTLKRRHLLESGQALPFVGDDFTAPDFFKDMEFRPVKNIAELKAACNLVYEEYLKLGYIDPNAARLKFTVYQTIATTTTFVAVYHKQGSYPHVLGTLTAVIDSPLGLPMDHLYKQELDQFRKKDHRMFEASMFAFDADQKGVFDFPLTRSHKLLLVLYLFKGVFDYIRAVTPVDLLVGCWHPRHEVLYKFMQMKLFGGLKANESVKGNPAVARCLDIRWGEKKVDSIASMRFFFGQPLPHKESFPKKPKFTFEDLDSLYVKSSQKASPGKLSEPASPSTFATSLLEILRKSSPNKPKPPEKP